MSPMNVDEVVLVIRTFPIRVGGASGPLTAEVDWDTVTAESGYSTAICEYTTVTQRIRRVARFEAEVVKRAILHNRPTCIALNHLDYIDAACASTGRVTGRAVDFVETAERSLGARISLLGLGPAVTVRRESSDCRLAV